MKRHILFFGLCVVLMVCLLCACSDTSSQITETTTKKNGVEHIPENPDSITSNDENAFVPIREIEPLNEGASLGTTYFERPIFDWEDITNRNNVFFRGKVEDLKEYEIFALQTDGEYDPVPFYHTIYTVTPVKIYSSGSFKLPSPVEMIVYTSSREKEGGAYEIKPGEEYIFIAGVLTEEGQRAYGYTLDLHKYAPIIMADLCYNMMPIIDGQVLFLNDYPFAEKGVKPDEKLLENSQLNNFLFKENVIAMELKAFEDEYLPLINKQKGGE